MKEGFEQCTDTILMIRPFRFRYNEQSAVNNYYMNAVDHKTGEEINDEAIEQFNVMVASLDRKGVNVIVINDEEHPDTPDSIFPNNWVSFHQNGYVGIYPMYASNRREERRTDIFEILQEQYGFKIEKVVDFTRHEDSGRYMEGTGSMALDRVNKIAYAALSERTDHQVFQEFCKQFNYRPVTFVANQTVNGARLPIYHTNVLMCVADHFVVVCLDAIDNRKERAMVVNEFYNSDKEIINISEEQKHQFAGNMLQVKSTDGRKYTVMSSTAFHSLKGDQIAVIEKYSEIIHSPLSTIETLGGGSARCMMAEVFLPKK